MPRHTHFHPVTGVYAALLTPRRPGTTEVDAAAFLEYLDRVSRAGVDGLVLFGSTGEFIHYDVEERMRLLSLAAKRSRIPTLVNASHSTVSGAVSLCEHAAEVGASGVLVMPPYFYTHTEGEIESFYLELAARVEGQISIYLYQLPFYTNAMTIGLMARLLGTGRFAGVKDSSGDWHSLEALLSARTANSFQVLAGSEKLFTRAMARGADGVVSGVAAALPELMVTLSRVSASDAGAADSLDRELQQFLTWVDQFPPTVAIKQAAAVRGWLPASIAVPLGAKLEADLGTLRERLNDWVPRVVKLSAEIGAVRT